METDSDDDDSTYEEYIFDSDDINSYQYILNSLTEDWLVNELHHRVTKDASNALFEIAKKWFSKLIEAKDRKGVTTKVPQMVHLRRQMYKKHVPSVSLEFGYKDKSTGEIHIMKNLESTPITRFPPNKFLKLYEIASVKVISVKKNSDYFTPVFLL